MRSTGQQAIHLSAFVLVSERGRDDDQTTYLNWYSRLEEQLLITQPRARSSLPRRVRAAKTLEAKPKRQLDASVLYLAA